MLFSNVHHVNCKLIKVGHLDKGMEFFRHLGIHELVHKSIFILLASSRTSRHSYKDDKKDYWQTNRKSLTRLILLAFFEALPERKTENLTNKRRISFVSVWCTYNACAFNGKLLAPIFLLFCSKLC